MEEKLKFNELTRKIIGAAFEVHKFLGNGFQEVIYQKALAYEFYLADIKYEREVSRDIFYKNREKAIGTRRADFIVEDKVIVEIKAISKLEDVHSAQILNYMNIYNIEVGLLINFGSKSMEFKRFVLTKKV